MAKYWITKILKGIVFVVFISLVMGYVVMFLWNMTLPVLFEVPEITFIQSLALLILTKILFGSFRAPFSHKHKMSQGHWRKRWEEKMDKMTPEEREKYQNNFFNKCGWYDKDKGEASSTQSN